MNPPLQKDHASMPKRTFRALIAAFVIALASLGGALYLTHERLGHQNAEILLEPGTGMASLDLHALLLNPRSADQRMLDNAFRQVEKAYYKPVNAQTLLNGEQRELVSYLRAHHIADPAIPFNLASGDEAHDVQLLNRDLQLAQSQYGKVTSDAELTQSAIRGMLNALGDPYTTYLSSNEISSLEESLRGGDFGGIGVYIEQDPRSKAIVVAPIEGTPAYRAGVKVADEILAVDGKPVAGLKLDEVEHLIRGHVGTVVHVLVRSHGAQNRHLVAITREKIIVPSVHAKLEGDIEYVRLADFGQTSYDEVRRAMLEGKAKGAKGYILDLRDNGGGLLDAAVQISSLFVPKGTIVSTIDRAGGRETKSAEQTSIGVAPLVVLVNKYTASASEITAGAIQDYKVGTLLGTKTFGKGVVQSIYNLSDGGALKITTARYVTPLGRDIQHKGIEPDIFVNQPVDLPLIDTPKDTQLSAAKQYLRHTTRKLRNT
ncbi:MAG TPA: S41 family peptidase [Candidatus Baltobacteraceae bacterium]|nr:S41 family peptidase [Candidatus Baltobacteraceae bacterium]